MNEAICYIVLGEPLHLVRETHFKEGDWTTMKSMIVKFEISLESQHEGSPIRGDVALDLNFYMDPLYQPPSQQKKCHQRLVNLIRFVEESLKHTVMREGCNIKEINAKKFISKKNNRTEIIVRKLDE